MDAPSPRALAGARGPLAAGLLYLGLAVVWAAPSSLSPWDTVPDLGDPLHLAYVMAWDAHQLVRDPLRLYDSNSFYPYPRSLAFGDHLLPEALLVAPLNWLTGNAVLASNLGVVLALTLSGLSMFWLVRSLTGSWGAGLLAGLVYGFNSFTRHELLRVHVLNLQYWPLGLWFLGRFVRKGGRARDAFGLMLCLALQGLSGAYYLVCTALVAPLWLLAAYVAERRAPRAREAALVAGAAAAVAAPCALLLWPYLGQLREMGFAKALVDGADLLCYVDPVPASVLWGGFDLYSGCYGLPHFLGFVALALAGVGLAGLLRRRLEPASLAAALSGAAGLALSLGPELRVGGADLGPGPFALLHAWVPLVRGMDGSKRIGVLAVLGLAVLAGHGAAALLRRWPGAPARLAAAALGLLLVVEHWTPPQAGAAVPTGAAVPEVYRFLEQESRDPLVELPVYPDVVKRYWSAYLYFSTYHWRRIPVGRTSFYPPAHDFLAESLRGFPDEVALTLLDRLGIRTLVVHPLAWEPVERAARLAALDADPRLRLIRRFDEPPDPRHAALGLGQERVYRLLGPVTAGPKPCTPDGELPRQGWRLDSVRRGRPVAAPLERRVPRSQKRWLRDREWRTPWLASLAADGDRATAWTTADAQRQGDGLELRLPAAATVAAVSLDLAYPYDEFPRELVLLAEGGGEQRRRLAWEDGPEARWETLQDLLTRPRDARLVLRVRPQALEALAVRIGAGGEDEAWPRWSVPELRLFSECR